MTDYEKITAPENVERAKRNAPAPLTDWELIVATLHYRGVSRDELSDGDRRAAWVEADGYGKMTAVELRKMGLFGDWSHIRDSSREGVARVAHGIREIVGGYGLLRIMRKVAKAGGPTDHETVSGDDAGRPGVGRATGGGASFRDRPGGTG